MDVKLSWHKLNRFGFCTHQKNYFLQNGISKNVYRANYYLIWPNHKWPESGSYEKSRSDESPGSYEYSDEPPTQLSWFLSYNSVKTQ